MKNTSCCSHCFSNLAVDSRMQIFTFLKDRGAKTVSEIVEQTVLSQPTVSYHLKNMETNGLLSKKRVGKEIHYQINENCPHDEKTCLLKQMNFTN